MFITDNGNALETHLKEVHSMDISEIETDLFQKSQVQEEIFKCHQCEFHTTNKPGLKSHHTKMHKVKHQCSEVFVTRNKLKSHIY
jgi:hypothetical protein